MHHLASTPVSLCRGLIHEDDHVRIHSHDERDIDLVFKSPSVFKSKPSFDCSASTTDCTTSSSDLSSLGDRDCFTINESIQEEFAAKTDKELMVGIEEAIREDKMVLVSYYLREMEGRNLQMADPKRHATYVQNTRMIEDVIVEHETAPEVGGWKKNSMLHGKHGDTIIYHRVNEQNDIRVRVEMALDESMLVPLLAVFNETDYYTTWLPSFQRPVKLGMQSTEKLHSVGRALQIARARMNMPWPMRNREIVAFNVIAEAVDEIGALVVKVKGLDEGEHSGCVVPPVPDGWDRIDLDGGFMVRKCPKDHPALQKRQKKATSVEKEPVLVSMTLGVKPSINMITKAIAAPLWLALLHVAEGVRDGKRPALKKAIDDKPELYNWVSESMAKLKATSR